MTVICQQTAPKYLSAVGVSVALMSHHEPTHETEDRIELPPEIVDVVAGRIAEKESWSEIDVLDAAFDSIDRHTVLRTEGGEPLVDAVADRVAES